MKQSHYLALALTFGCIAALIASMPQSRAQGEVAILAPDEAREQLELATRANEEAEARAARFARDAKEADEAAQRAASEEAALAARIQQNEAQIAAARARYSLTQVERARLANRLAQRQQPLVRLTAALQTNARRPLALSALQPGSLKDLVYVRAVLDSAVPQIQARTSALRSELEEGLSLERRARRMLTELRQGEGELKAKRDEMVALATSQRLASEKARGEAAREEERALVLAEEARDLDGLIDKLDTNAKRRQALAALPGPILRPSSLGGADDAALALDPSGQPPPPQLAGGAPRDFQLPVQGRTVTGFAEQRSSGIRSKGIMLLPQPGAQVIAPASGRVVFAGPYEGFGRIVIIEHASGWSSLVTGLARSDVAVGDQLIGGAPLGVADTQGGTIGIELRESGEPVNPLDYLQ
ncbi:MAG: peptidoglycan DD-metalloendopeptidase family protein [Pseudomonadota bacterium]